MIYQQEGKGFIYFIMLQLSLEMCVPYRGKDKKKASGGLTSELDFTKL